jgi:hypothetical protein
VWWGGAERRGRARNLRAAVQVKTLQEPDLGAAGMKGRAIHDDHKLERPVASRAWRGLRMELSRGHKGRPRVGPLGRAKLPGAGGVGNELRGGLLG